MEHASAHSAVPVLKPKVQATDYAQTQSPGNRLRREAAGVRGRKCLVRGTEKVTQLQGVPIDVGSVREGEGQETRCESTGGCERKPGRPAGDIRGGGTRAQQRRGCSRAAAGKEYFQCGGQ